MDKFPGRAVPINKFVKEQTDIPWLVDRLLPAVGWTLFVGTMGFGKTTFAIQLCAAMNRGIPFLGRKTVKKKFAYVQVDSPEEEWRFILKRVDAECTGYTLVTLPINCLDNPNYMSATANLLAMVEPEFIVYDSLYKFSSVSVNSDKVQSTIEKLYMLSMGTPWMLIHHPPHEESRAAGHHSIEATASNVWYLQKTRLQIAKARLVAEKEILMQRMGEKEGGIWKLREREGATKGRAFIPYIRKPGDVL